MKKIAFLLFLSAPVMAAETYNLRCSQSALRIFADKGLVDTQILTKDGKRDFWFTPVRTKGDVVFYEGLIEVGGGYSIRFRANFDIRHSTSESYIQLVKPGANGVARIVSESGEIVTSLLEASINLRNLDVVNVSLPENLEMATMPKTKEILSKIQGGTLPDGAIFSVEGSCIPIQVAKP
ncbi:hypothetical protein K2X33_04465 [bacterium]|nr:hypothetical protein [bacterium]